MRFVSGVGKANVDILYGGMPRVPQEGEEIYAQSFSLQLGGGIPATLIALSRLGVPVKIQTFLGHDLFSRFVEEQLIENGAAFDNLYDGGGMPVNITSAVITKNDRAFTSYSDALTVTANLMAQVREKTRGASVVLMHEDFLPIYPELKSEGAVLVYDTGWRLDMRLDNMGGTLELADWYTPNALEAMHMTGSSSPSEAAKALSGFFKHTVIKLGAGGCLLYSGGAERVIPAIPGTVAVDTTGAGDAFLAGLVYGLYHGSAPDMCVLYGNIMGAQCVKSTGALSSYVNEIELLELARRYSSLISG